MNYSNELIERIKDSNNIVDVISQYVTLKRKGTTYFGLCPFHREKTPSFAVSETKQVFHCFGCHKYHLKKHWKYLQKKQELNYLKCKIHILMQNKKRKKKWHIR